MGKDLKGKELGRGLSQRKDGRYSARFVMKSGKRVEKYSWKLQEVKRWLLDKQYEDEHCSIYSSSQMTVDTWFEYWIKEIKGPMIRESSIRIYHVKYNKHIGPVIGNMIISEVKPLHCQSILTTMLNSEFGYSLDTIRQVRMSLHAIFEAAVENEFIIRNPVNKSVNINYESSEKKEPRVLTVEEQKRFFEAAVSSRDYNQYVLMIQTGMRIGEIIGLCWQDVDFKNRIISVNKNMQWHAGHKKFIIGPPKSKNGIRKIPMTDVTYNMLKNLAEKRDERKVYNFEYANIVFQNQYGEPIKNLTYNSTLRRLAQKIGIEGLTPHVFRHTFATRCIEAGMRPKTLQKILGHATLNITMNLYVHVLEDTKTQEMLKFEAYMNQDAIKMA